MAGLKSRLFKAPFIKQQIGKRLARDRILKEAKLHHAATVYFFMTC
jgi:hypothetical protein